MRVVYFRSFGDEIGDAWMFELLAQCLLMLRKLIRSRQLVTQLSAVSPPQVVVGMTMPPARPLIGAGRAPLPELRSLRKRWNEMRSSSSVERSGAGGWAGVAKRDQLLANLLARLVL